MNISETFEGAVEAVKRPAAVLAVLASAFSLSACVTLPQPKAGTVEGVFIRSAVGGSLPARQGAKDGLMNMWRCGTGQTCREPQ